MALWRGLVAAAFALAGAAKSKAKFNAYCADRWGQCGGVDAFQKPWAGPKCCQAGDVCVEQSDEYSMCTPTGDDEVETTTVAPTTTTKKKKAPKTTTEVETTAKKTTVARTTAAPTTTEAPTTAAAQTTEAEPAVVDDAPLPNPHPEPAVNPIVVKGVFLYDSVTQKRFFAKGIDYNPRPVAFEGKSSTCSGGTPKYGPVDWGTDLIADELESLWSEDLDAIAEMGVNTIRIYDLDPEKSHDKFMAKAARLGIYVIIPLTRHNWGFLPAGLASPLCYTTDLPGYGVVGTNLVVSAKLIVKQFSKYNNTLMFTVGNEVETNDKDGMSAMPCVKALTRDIHKYQNDCAFGMRRVPLLYAGTDVGGEGRKLIAQYLTCDQEPDDGVDDAVDVYGLNVYSWCDRRYVNEQGQDAFDYSPYFEIERDLGHMTKPILFTEFGCNIGEFKMECPYKGGRTWPDVVPIMGRMAQLLSGALAYEYSMEGSKDDNQFGVVLKPGFLNGQDTLVKLDEYWALRKVYLTHNISSRWDGKWDDSNRCSWDPAFGPFAHPTLGASLSTPRYPQTCPAASALRKLFRERHGKNTWLQSLAATPNGTDVVDCPRYPVSDLMLKESMCFPGVVTTPPDIVPTPAQKVLTSDHDHDVAKRAKNGLDSMIYSNGQRVSAPLAHLSAVYDIYGLNYNNLSDSQQAMLKTVYSAALSSAITSNDNDFLADRARVVKPTVALVSKQGSDGATRLIATVNHAHGTASALRSDIALEMLEGSTNLVLGDSYAVTNLTVALVSEKDLDETPENHWGWPILGGSLAVVAAASVLICAIRQSDSRSRKKKRTRSAHVDPAAVQQELNPGVERSQAPPHAPLRPDMPMAAAASRGYAAPTVSFAAPTWSSVPQVSHMAPRAVGYQPLTQIPQGSYHYSVQQPVQHSVQMSMYPRTPGV